MSVDLNPSADQRQILDAARSLLRAHFPVERLRGPHTERLDEIAAFGALGLALPEKDGGAGFALSDEALLHVEFGRHLVTPSVLAGAVAARVALAAGQGALAQDIIAGTARVALAVQGQGRLRALDPQGAALALWWDGSGLSLFDLSTDPLSPRAAIDDSAALGVAETRALPLVASADTDRIRHIADLLVGAQLLGIAEAARDMAVAHACMRQQFGQPIGAFQAVKHHCANMAIAAELASAQLDMAALHVQSGQPDAAFQVASARHLAQAAAMGNARLNIQIHGGIGFSAECDAHLFLKRAHALSLVGGAVDLLAHDAPLTPLQRS